MTESGRYGISRQAVSSTAIDRAVEQTRLLGYAIVDGGYTRAAIDAFGEAFDRARDAQDARHGGRAALEAIDEHHTIRLPMLYERLLLDLATHDGVLEIARRLMGPYVVLNQQNGVINPRAPATRAGVPAATTYSQARVHRDLPYQHFVSSRPLGVTALFCLDDFTAENGATWIVPGSHKEEAFPSDAVVDATKLQAVAPAGHFIVMDAMTFHSGGVNHTDRDRRGVNHVLTIPLIKQQIALPTALGDSFATDPALRRLLGYEVMVPPDVAAYYATRRQRSRS